MAVTTVSCRPPRLAPPATPAAEAEMLRRALEESTRAAATLKAENAVLTAQLEKQGEELALLRGRLRALHDANTGTREAQS